jgi:hypothetical protein
MPINTTIEAATVLYIVNNRTNTTRTSTIFADLPSGYTLPPMNDKGTQVQSFAWTEVGGEVRTTTMAFPTQFWAYPAGYYWTGRLSTTDSNGASICATASDSSYVPFHSYKTSSQLPLDTSRLGDNGLSWTTIHEVLAMPPNPSPNPSDGAILSCKTAGAVAPASAVETASFLTVTSTSHEDDGPTTTANKASSTAPKPTSATAESQVQGSTKSGTTSPVVKTSSVNAGAPSSTNVAQTVLSGTTYQAVSQTGQPTAKSPSDTSSVQGAHSNVPSSVLSISHIVIGSTTFTPVAATTQTSSTTAAAIVISGTAYYPITPSSGSNSVYHIGSQTLALGSTITVGSGSAAQTIALQTTNGKTELVVGSSTSAFTVASSSTLPGTVINVHEQTVTANSKSEFVISGQTLSVGGSIIEGSGSSTTVIALKTDSAGHTVLIAGGTSSTLASAAATATASSSTSASASSVTTSASVSSTTTSQGLGIIINSGLGGTGSAPTATSLSPGSNRRLDFTFGLIVFICFAVFSV